MYTFNAYAIPTLVIAVSLLVIAGWIVVRERASPLSRAFALAALTCFVWQITKTLMYLSSSPEVALVWAKLGYVGIVFIGPAMYYFSTHLLGVSERRKAVSAGSWLIGAIFLVVILSTDALVVGVQSYFWGYYPRWGWLGALFLPFFGTTMGLAVREFWLQYRQAGPGVLRARLRGLMIAFAIANTGGMDYLATYGYEVYPVGYVVVFAFLVVAAHAITRYRLVDLTPSFAAGQILATMSDPLIVLDNEGTVRIVNPAVGDVFGFERGDLIGRPATLLAGRDARAAARLQQLCGASAVRDQELTLYTREGDPVEVSLATSQIDDVEGATVGTVLIARDIRERTLADRALRQSEERFRSLIQNVSDVILVFDAELKIRFVSDSVERVFGFTPDALVGRDVLTLVHPDDLGQAHAALADLAEPGATLTIEIRVSHADGGWRIAEATGTNRVQDPAVSGFIVVYQDVTAKKAAEAALRERDEQLRHSQRMEAVGRLAGGVAHDFNNLLTVINGEMLLLLEQPQAEPEVRTALEEVLRAGNRASDLTRQLLAFSRRLVLQPKLLDLNLVVSDLEKMLRRLIGEDVKLAVALEPNLDHVKADPGQVEQVILNLVVNARDALPRGGAISIETRNVLGAEVPGLEPGVRYVSVSVRDNGIGMDEQTLERVFEPFFTTKEQGKGTGLGLSTVYGIVEQSGGTVQAESRPGQGSVFRVFLPRAEESAPVVGSKPSVLPSAARGSETVLLVEDEDSVRALAQTILQRCGYTVLSARNGSHARRICEEPGRAIDLLVTDVVMPGMGGREVAEMVAGLFPEIRVLYMSGYTDDAILRHGVEQGMAFLPKPFTPAELAQKVRQMLDAPRSPADLAPESRAAV